MLELHLISQLLSKSVKLNLWQVGVNQIQN